MRFISPQHDVWHSPPEGEDGPVVNLSPSAHSLLTLAQWHAVRGHWPSAMPVGVLLPNDADVEALHADLPRLQLIALSFPKWTDGRAYSQARLLRARLKFQGEVRAVHEVLVDMLPLLARTGFDAVVLRADQSLEAAKQALAFFEAGHYQSDAQQPTSPRWPQPELGGAERDEILSQVTLRTWPAKRVMP